MVPEEAIRLGADAPMQLSESRPEGYMDSQRIFGIEGEALALQPVAGWEIPEAAESAEWIAAGGLLFDTGPAFPDPPGPGEGSFPALAFGEDDEDDDDADDEDNFDDMEDDFEDDFEDEDDDFDDDDDDDFEDDDDDDYDYDDDGDYDDDFDE
jgi:hypothetical protein